MRNFVRQLKETLIGLVLFVWFIMGLVGMIIIAQECQKEKDSNNTSIIKTP